MEGDPHAVNQDLSAGRSGPRHHRRTGACGRCGGVARVGGGRSFSLVATKASNRSRAYIYVDGVYKKTIDLYSATMARTVVYSLYSTSSTQHTVTVKVADKCRPYVDLDAWTIF